MRSALLFAVSAVFLAPADMANAQQYPNRPVQVLVSNGGGSAVDLAARLPLAKVSAVLGQPFVVINRPGAAGAIAAQAIAAAAPDGYTLLVTSDSTYTSVPYINKNAGFDPRNITAIGPISELGTAVFVNASLNVRTLDEFVALARSKPGQLNYSHFDVGQVGPMWMDHLFERLGIKVQHIPYKTGAEIMQAVVSGDVAITSSSISSAQGAVDAGRVIPIMFSGPRPSSGAYSHVPDQAKLLPGLLEPTTTHGLFGPPGLPSAIVNILSTQLRSAIESPDVAAAMEKAGITPNPGSPDDLNKIIERRRLGYSEIIKRMSPGAN